MQMWLNLPWLVVSCFATGHATALLSVHLQNLTLVQMLSYHSHVNLTSRNFPKYLLQNL
ncbi:unnamed protein product [Callosobruchus maculatus]|uniref:Uncharacterized protein n=1 Tax=Callosobruchus maculatus TaxID=64391 RepID=A0A653BT91_CALMS|nr:unnamed protein product [Callosobruchus maculatus]